jgi:E3 ubiquitin-protein ligase RBBP6
MSSVHYKFKSSIEYDTVTFDGLHISLADLKKAICTQKKITRAEFDLQVTNAQTGEEYSNNDALIPKNASVVIVRVPIGGISANIVGEPPRMDSQQKPVRIWSW